MALSGSTDFSVTAMTILKGAMRCIGALPSGENPTGEETVDGLEALNMMVKSWMGAPDVQTKGLKMWQRATSSLTLKAQISYSIKPSGGDLDIDAPVAILAANKKNTDNVESPLIPMLMEEYFAISNKTATGSPGKFYYERKLDEGMLYLDIIPSDLTDTVEFAYLRILQDLDATSHDVDFPQHWYEALKYNLAIRIAPEFDTKVSQLVMDLATVSLAKAQSFYPETSEDYFQPGKD